MGKIRFALVGCGRISGKHVAAIQSFSERAEIVSVCDTQPSRAFDLAQKIGSAVTAYSDLKTMLTSEVLDVACILTPSGNHAESVLTCKDYVKNIVVEKPMALRLRDADQIIRECKVVNTRLFVVKQNRYNPPVVLLKKAIQEGRFGRLLVGTVRVRWARSEDYYLQAAWRGTWAQDGGVFSNQASHHVDLLTWLMGPSVSVFAKTSRFLAPIEAEDTGIALLKFKSGALGVIEATTCARPKDLEGSISILGENGVVEIAGFAVNQVRTWQFKDTQPSDEAVFASSTQPSDVYGFGHQAYYEDVLASIEGNVAPVVDGISGRTSLELISAIYESAESSKEILLEGFQPNLCRLGEG